MGNPNDWDSALVLRTRSVGRYRDVPTAAVLHRLCEGRHDVLAHHHECGVAVYECGPLLARSPSHRLRVKESVTCERLIELDQIVSGGRVYLRHAVVFPDAAHREEDLEFRAWIAPARPKEGEPVHTIFGIHDDSCGRKQIVPRWRRLRPASEQVGRGHQVSRSAVIPYSRHSATRPS